MSEVINAAVAIGLFGSYAEAVERMVRPARHFEPVAGNRSRFQALLDLYGAERRAMMDVWAMRQSVLGA